MTRILGGLATLGCHVAHAALYFAVERVREEVALRTLARMVRDARPAPVTKLEDWERVTCAWRGRT